VRETAYLSLGSNLGDRAANLRAAVAQLDVAGGLLAVSSLYETQPVDIPDQPWFLNCVAAIETDKTPRELLKLALQVEASMGRLRMTEKGPRKIDIDVVLFGDYASGNAPAAVCSGTVGRDRSKRAPSRTGENGARTAGGVASGTDRPPALKPPQLT
jgi:2-amino-4-hydroxy-6-hydroxymethyldihydropteridine diphosphokinase